MLARERQRERIKVMWGNLYRKYFCIDIKGSWCIHPVHSWEHGSVSPGSFLIHRNKDHGSVVHWLHGRMDLHQTSAKSHETLSSERSVPLPYLPYSDESNQNKMRFYWETSLPLSRYLALDIPPSVLQIQKTYSRRRGRISKAPKQAALPFLYRIIYTSYNYASD